jgi:ABC-type transport system involved in cytochrome c biogenesis permease subunit
MKKHLPWIIPAIFALWVIASLFPKAEKPEEFHLAEFGKLPVLLNGRIQPMDSVARNALLILRARQTVYLGDETESVFQKAATMPAVEWMLEAMSKPEQADQRKVFRIDNPELRGELKLDEKRKFYSFDQLKASYETIQKQAEQIVAAKPQGEAAKRTPIEKQMLKLQFAMNLYIQIENSLHPENTPDFLQELQVYKETLKPGLEAVQKSQTGGDYNKEDLAMIGQFFKRYSMLAKVAYPLVVPPTDSVHNRDGWLTVGASLKESMHSLKIDPAVEYYAQMAEAFAQNKPAEFNRAVADYRAYLTPQFIPELKKGIHESFFNSFAPFYKSMILYLTGLIFALAYWFNWSPWLNRTAFRLLIVSLVVHTTGLIFRMVLEGRPPVTNLYSSAIFIGWGAVVLGLILERIYRDGIGAVTASCIGFTTLVIAHNLSLDGDTMEMLQAVLDTNFWLATHVVIVTLGYASTFLAGFLGILYIIRGALTRSLSPQTGKSLSRMVYGIVCFATLFSFVGTVLGGIWADQSWGRFWGWDPKENGALLIVIWNAAILHARLGGMVRERGLMGMVVFGNIVTSFSWFGVNMLGIGLHSYGFMDQAFKWLMAFDVSQLLILGLACVPPRYWRSFQGPGKPPANRQAEPGMVKAVPAGV